MSYEAIGMTVLILVGLVGILFFIRLDWKRYGALFLISCISANLICYMFTTIGFYSFPNNVLHRGFPTPFALVSTVFPFLVLFAVRYSPEKWAWKIPFYWGIVHLGVLGEVILLSTSIFRFEPEWDLWDSYTLWWIYLLLFDWIGGKLIPAHLRSPISSGQFRYGKWGWLIFHVVVIVTIFLAGVYVGVTIFQN